MRNAYSWIHHTWLATRAEIAFVVLLVLIGWSVVLSLYVVSGKPAGDLPVIGGDTVERVPATGEQGFNTAVFCDDPLTKVATSLAPDASGITYVLSRVKDGVTESVVLTFDQTDEVVYAKHFFDRSGQQSEPAFVTDDARDCIEDKAK